MALQPAFTPDFLAFDLEIHPQQQRIFKLGAIRSDDSAKAVTQDKPVKSALVQLDQLAEGVDFLLGHNLLEYDIPFLKIHHPDLSFLDKPVVDTLLLNPLAFPKNPYHRLVKVYQDGRLCQGQRSNPLADSALAMRLFYDQLEALQQADPALLRVWYWLLVDEDEPAGLNQVFAYLCQQDRPDDLEATDILDHYLGANGCIYQIDNIIHQAKKAGWSLAYVLAWLSVCGGHSVMPPWVRLQFPEAARMVMQLRDTPCHQSDCEWCNEKHDAVKQLKNLFGFDSFREEPVHLPTLKPLQQVIVEKSMAREHVLGILPTGTGKSLCYQIPSLTRYEKSGSLTLVISPLVALMADQVRGMEAKGITCSAALNGLLSMPERQQVLDKIRLGDIGILIVSPEMLRSSSFHSILKFFN